MLTFLLVIQAIVAVLLVGVILMQQSEGGGLGMGGSPSGLMSARGAADFLTRSTAVLAGIFIALSILHAVLASQTNRGGDIDTSLAKRPAPTAPAPAAPGVPIGAAPAGGAPVTGVPVPAPVTQAPATVPMATAPKAAPRTERAQPKAAAPASATTAAPPPVAATVPAPAAAGGNAN